MSIVLRDYQERVIHEARIAYREKHKSVLLQMPTGAGKTITAGYMVGEASSRGNDTMFICNRVELLAQTGRAFGKLGIRPSYIAPDYKPDYTSRVQIASIDTLKVRIKSGKIKAPKFVVWDECRSIAAKGWADVWKWLDEQGARQLGLDATPLRHDGKPLRQFFSHMVLGPSYSELETVGALVPFDCYAPPIDLSGIRTKGFEYDQEQLGEQLDKPKLVGGAVDHYMEHARGMLGLTFAVSRKHSEHLAAAYCAAGIPALHVDGDSDPHFRREAVKAFRRREVLQLCNVDLFTAGFDVPGVQVIVDCAPTKSLAKALQKWGRGSRPDEENPEKTSCILLDHANNMNEHGFPDDDRTWSLDGRTKAEAKKERELASVDMRQCPKCYKAHKPAPTCPKCGHEYPIQSRELEQVEGKLVKLTKEDRQRIKEEKAALAKQQRREEKNARTLEELERIGAARGNHKDWAQNVFDARARARERWSDKLAQQQFDSYEGWKR